jgi:hypothetical protein
MVSAALNLPQTTGLKENFTWKFYYPDGAQISPNDYSLVNGPLPNNKIVSVTFSNCVFSSTKYASNSSIQITARYTSSFISKSGGQQCFAKTSPASVAVTLSNSVPTAALNSIVSAESQLCATQTRHISHLSVSATEALAAGLTSIVWKISDGDGRFILTRSNTRAAIINAGNKGLFTVDWLSLRVADSYIIQATPVYDCVKGPISYFTPVGTNRNITVIRDADVSPSPYPTTQLTCYSGGTNIFNSGISGAGTMDWKLTNITGGTPANARFIPSNGTILSNGGAPVTVSYNGDKFVNVCAKNINTCGSSGWICNPIYPAQPPTSIVMVTTTPLVPNTTNFFKIYPLNNSPYNISISPINGLGTTPYRIDYPWSGRYDPTYNDFSVTSGSAVTDGFKITASAANCSSSFPSLSQDFITRSNVDVALTGLTFTQYGTTYIVKTYIRVPQDMNNPNLDLLDFDDGLGNPTPMTLEAWIQANTSQNGNPTSVIYSNWDPQLQTGFQFGIDNSNGKLFLSGVGIIAISNNTNSLLDNICHHVAVTRNGANINFYIDGQLAGTGTMNANYSLKSSEVRGLIIGNASLTDYDRFNTLLPNTNFNGMIKECRVWNIERASSDIADFMSIALGGDELGLINYLRLTEGTGTVAYDHKALKKIDGVFGYTSNLYSTQPQWEQIICSQAIFRKGITEDILLNSSQIAIYPNPASDQFTIYIPETNSDLPAYIEILDLQSKVIIKKETVQAENSLNSDNLASGMYLIRIKQGGNTKSFKFNIIK